MKRWKVVTEFWDGFDLTATMLGYGPRSPHVQERFYRWRWTARFAAFRDNLPMIGASPLVVGLMRSRVERNLPRSNVIPFDRAA